MTLTFARATHDEQPIVANLLQFCLYDLCDCGDGPAWDVAGDGRFPYHRDLASFFTNPMRHAFLARVDGNIAGFGLVIEYLEPQRRAAWSEFFVLRKYRRQGVGARLATFVFDQFPGPWEVKERERNTGAITFWRQLIGQITDGRYTEETWSSEHGHGPVQRFIRHTGMPAGEKGEAHIGYAS